jgi:hypothetical protein
MSQHTPGPWIVEPGDFNLWIGTPSEHDAQQVAHIVVVIQQDLHNMENRAEKKTNARLIAAAPELLEALKIAETALAKTLADRRSALEVEFRLSRPRHYKLFRIGQHLARLGTALIEVRAAAAKAEGGQ